MASEPIPVIVAIYLFYHINQTQKRVPEEFQPELTPTDIVQPLALLDISQ
jgi:hypothetical protein